MASITINEALVLQKAVRARLSELQGLRTNVATKETWIMGTNAQKTTEPQYDVKAVDRKVAELEKFLLKSESAVKAANAMTYISVDFDTDQLLEPLA